MPRIAAIHAGWHLRGAEGVAKTLPGAGFTLPIGEALAGGSQQWRRGPQVATIGGLCHGRLGELALGSVLV